MSAKSTILKLFNVHPKEGPAVLLLLVHSFFIGLFIAYFFSFANGIFIREFKLAGLPYAYAASGVVGLLVSLLFAKLQLKINYFKLLTGSLIFILLLTILFWLGLLMVKDTKWLIFTMFIWVAPFLMLISLQYWGMTMKLFDLRQGKRLFGLIGSGDVVSSILGFASVHFILDHMDNAVHLLLLAIIGLIGGLVFQFIIIKKISFHISDVEIKEKPKEKISGSLSEMFGNRYFRSIFILVLFSVIASYIIDYGFLGIANERNPEKNDLTKFIGMFFGVIKTVELLSKTLVAGRLLDKYGINIGLIALPILLVIFTLIGFASIETSATIFFLAIAMNKLFDRVVRRSMEEPAFKMLYQPLDPETKTMMQTQAEGKGKQIALILAGCLLIICSLIPSFEMEYTIYILGVLLIGWLYSAYRVQGGYRNVLMEKLSAYVQAKKKRKSGNLSSSGIFKKGLENDHEWKIMDSIHLLEKIEPGATWPHYEKLLGSNSIAVQKKVIDQIGKTYFSPLLEEIQKLSQNVTDLTLKDQLSHVESTLNSTKAITKSEIMTLTESSSPDYRIKAAKLLGHMEIEEKTALLHKLLEDKNENVVKAALSSIQDTSDFFFQNKLITSLDNPALGGISFRILATSDKSIVPALIDAFINDENNTLISMKITQLLGIIGGKESERFLIDNLSHSNSDLRYLSLGTLEKLGYTAGEDDFTHYKQEIEKETAFCTWLIAAIIDLQKDEVFEELIILLTNEFEASKGRIFSFLSFLYEAEVIKQIKNNLESGIKAREVLAIELADLILDEDLQEIIFPILDTISFPEKLKQLSRTFPQQKFKKTQRLKDIINHDFSKVNRWIKARAIKHLTDVLFKLQNEITSNVYHKDLLIKETTLISLHNMDPQIYDEYINHESAAIKNTIDTVLGISDGSHKKLSVTEKVQLMKRNSIFSNLPETILVKIAFIAEETKIYKNEDLPSPVKQKGNLYMVIEGVVKIDYQNGINEFFKEGELIGLIDRADLKQCNFSVEELTHLIYINSERFFELVRVHIELAEIIYKIAIEGDKSQNLRQQANMAAEG